MKQLPRDIQDVIKICLKFAFQKLLPLPQLLYGSGHICSGTLISNFTVLTSASCLLNEMGEFYKAADLKVTMGNLNRMTVDDNTFSTNVKAVRPHGRFNSRTLLNNLALLEVFVLMQ